MEKILVTGATGFLGSYVIRELLERGESVIATSQDPKKAQTFDWFPHVSYVPFNIQGQMEGLNYFDFFQCPDRLIHLAWEGLPNYQQNFHLEENLIFHKSFLLTLVAGGLKDVTVAGTCFEYGMLEGCLNEQMAVEPTTAYGKAKNFLRIFLQDLQKSFPFSLKWARLFYLYGEGQNPKSLISQLKESIRKGELRFNMSGGQQIRDFLDVSMAAKYLVAMSLQDSITGVINCGSGNGVTVEHFVKQYLDKHKLKMELNLGYYPYIDYEPMRFWSDNTRLNQILENE